MKMQLGRIFFTVGTFVLISTVSQNAFARRNDRSGFNFGTSFQMNDSTQPSLISGTHGSTAKSTGQTKVTQPYVGYAFGDFLSLGIHGTFSDFRGSDTISGSNENERIASSRMSSLTGGGAYARFLFGEIMFFEAAAGYYERMTSIDTEYIKDQADGGFSGTKESMKVRSVGSGYRLGGGVEVPVAYSFYFTAGYFASYYQLKPVEIRGNADKSNSYENTHEITFGIAHYYN